jgi:cellulose synthase/poly-beta-1,6-N-acetylglucosamine synthase-like glycosyltransferase
MVFMQYAFWLLLFILVYTYIGYPILIFLISKISAKEIEKDLYEPFVSILIAAYNEEEHIRNTIENKLVLNYPKGKIEIIVISDGSTDRTDEIVNRYCKNNVKLLRQDPRKGKTAALNMAVTKARGEILVFSDANSIFDEDALLHMMQNFVQPKVGYVTGKMVYTNPDGTMIGDGCSAYMKYENFLRENETKIGSVVGSNGGIDAVRKPLYDPMRDDQLPDFVLPLSVAEKGYRIIYEPHAILKEQALNSNVDEYRMRVRVSLRALWALYDMRHLLNPLRYRLFSWQIISHKLLRYMAFISLFCVFVINTFIISKGMVYLIAFLMQFTFYGLAYLGRIQSLKGAGFNLTRFPYYFTLLNFAAAQAFGKFIKGKKQVIWQPRAG